MPNDYFDDFSSLGESNFVAEFYKFQELISPSYILDSPYREILSSIARGDGKIYSSIRKSKLSQKVGEDIINQLISLNILSFRASREAPLRQHPKQKIKKEYRSYRIQDKLHFQKPYMRFWFGFVSYYSDELSRGVSDRFISNFNQHNERLSSLVYEQLCNDFLIDYYRDKNTIISSGGYWNIHSEFDILAITKTKSLILAECKYKNRKVCKNELTKLKVKAIQSGIKVDKYVLFSKSSFSKELLANRDKDLLIFDLKAVGEMIDFVFRYDYGKPKKIEEK